MIRAEFNPSEPQAARYWCFISYRHADNKEAGRQWATWLHQSIETYEVPDDLAGSNNERGDTIPERIFPVFRDEEELPADADLSSPIYRALDASRFLIVICSPRVVGSTYRYSPVNPHQPWTTLNSGATTWLPVPNANLSDNVSDLHVNACGSIVGTQTFTSGGLRGLLYSKTRCDAGVIGHP